MKKGKIIILSGPSGVGKKSVINIAREKFGFNAVLSISATTREPRAGEKNGVDYYFLSKKIFKDWIEKDKFIEWVVFANNYYGTPKKSVNNVTSQGKNVYLEIDVEGAKKIMKTRSDNMIFIFITPPSINELEQRLKKRKTETVEEVIERTRIARTEMNSQDLYDHVIINDNIDDAAKEISRIIKK